MFDPKLLRDRPEAVRRACALKRVDLDLDAVFAVSERRLALLQELETLRAERNAVSEEVAKRKREKADAADLFERMKSIGPRIKELEAEHRTIEASFHELLLAIPNPPHESVAEGGAEANQVVRAWGEKPSFGFEPRPHWEIGETLGLLDLPRGTKISGASFPLYRGLGARLERALISYFLDVHTKQHGCLEWFTPFLVNRDAMTGTGQLPKMAEDMYCTDKGDDLWLIPTAEVSVTNLHRDEILPAESLPLAYAAYSACFRREAGAAGKETRGITRVHQFNKVEMVRFVKPETSYETLERLVGAAEGLLQGLGLHYRVVQLAAGDLSFAASKCYDIEVWAPGMQAYLEVSSCSNFEDFQARRANIRYRAEEGKPRFLHTLNGSGLACPRAWIALVETHQQPDGGVLIPEVLRPYMGLDRIPPPGA